MAYPEEILSFPVYINGVKRLTTGLGAVFFADSDGLPGRRCSQHTLQPMSVLFLKNGGTVHTSGSRYSLHPDKEEPPCK